MTEFVPLPERDDEEELEGRPGSRVFLSWIVIVATVAGILSMGQFSDEEKDSGSPPPTEKPNLARQ